jgi:hypothetical protein
VRAAHHELCFGCGLANVFGLGIEAERGDDGVVRGRFFVKQDHQGADGRAHPGILAAGLIEALSLAAGEPPARPAVELGQGPPVGSFVSVEATPDKATLRGEAGEVVATAKSG